MRLTSSAWLLLLPLTLPGQQSRQPSAPKIPATWDDEAIRTLELPAANPKGSPVHITADFYYKMPVRPIYKTYPVYAPAREPAGYLDWLKRQEPQVIWGRDSSGVERKPLLTTEADWIRAGELVFDASILYDLITTVDEVRNPDWFMKTGAPVRSDGVLPFYRYAVREKGKVELGNLGCSTCHTRVMADGTAIKGAQGNFPLDRAEVYPYRSGRFNLKEVRTNEQSLFAVPWLRPDPHASLDAMTIEEISAAHEAIPPGVFARHRSSPFSPPQIPDLIGVKDRKYLDRTGLVRQRSVADFMRYAALNQGADDFASHDGFRPMQLVNEVFFGKARDAILQPSDLERYSDEQLYALALYVYALKPSLNPNRFDKHAEAGCSIFAREGCGTCHTPPLYTNNKLTPADGFTPPGDHLKNYDVMQVRIGTDPFLTLKTRRGTGYCKVPSLKGLWYRGMFPHDGSCATLEDWFDAARLRDDYVPTGFRGYGIKTRAVTGHAFGLSLSSPDKAALIAFLKTL